VAAAAARQLSDAGAALEGAFTSEGISLRWRFPMLPGSPHSGWSRSTGDSTVRQCTQIARATLAVGALTTARRHLVWLLALQAMARGDAAAAETSSAGQRPADPGSPAGARTEVCTEPHLVRLGSLRGTRRWLMLRSATAEQRGSRNPGVASIAATAWHAAGCGYDDPGDLRSPSSSSTADTPDRASLRP